MGVIKILIILTLSVLYVSSEKQCPITCYCDLISRYIHCQGDKNSNSKLLPTLISKDTQRLELRDYQIGTLKWELTRDLFSSELLELSIRNSDINEIINGSLSILIKLNNLDLSHNNIYLIQSNSFDQLNSLKHLDLGYNKLKEIKGNFLMLKNLETLDLSNNKLEILSIKTFTGLQNIQWIDISSNSITKIEPGTFLPMPNLERLVIGNNPLISLQRLEFLGARLRYMDVSDMKLKRAPESLGPSVRELRACRNELKSLQRGDLDSYPSLTLLDLSNNQLENIEDDALGRLEYLSRIYLIGNKLEKIPNSLPRALKVLILNDNNIKSINTADIQGLPRLQQLSLNSNKITVISNDFLAYLPGLRKLELSKNLITNITLSNSNLEELNLSDNSDLILKSDTFTGLSHLRILHLCNITKKFDNNIKEIITPLSELSTLNLKGSSNLTKQALELQIWFGLTELNIQNTSINTLPVALWSSMGKLKNIYLSHNLWNCTPEFQKNITLRDLKLKIMDESELKCEFPEILRGNTVILYNITRENKIPPSLAPTRLQIISPLKNATSKPESTAPLNYEENKIKNEVKKPKKEKSEVQIQASVINPLKNDTEKILNISETTTFKSSNLTSADLKFDNSTKKTISTVNTTGKLPEIIAIKPEVTTKMTKPEMTTTKREIVTTKKQNNNSIITTSFPPMDYEELAVVIDEEFYEEPGNFSEIRAGKIRALSERKHNIPIGFLSVIGVCFLGAFILFAYHYRQARNWHRLQPHEDILYMDTLTPETEQLRW